MVEDDGYDIVIRDPEGGILQRWLLNWAGWPCAGNGRLVDPAELWSEVVNVVNRDRRARKEQT